MSISFNQDNSTQLTYGAFPYTISPNDNYATSNYVNSFWSKNATNNLYLANITSNVGIGTTNPLYQLYIFTSAYNSKPLLVLNAGPRSAPFIPIKTARSIGQPLLGIGGDGYGSSAGDYYGIGFGYLFDPGYKYPCEIGCIITNDYNAEYGDLLFSTRTSTSATVAATERMRLTSAGNLALGLGINNTTYKLNVDGPINCTSFYENGTLITFGSFALNSTLLSYYTKTETDTLLATKQPTLTAATTLLGTGGSITGINYNTLINKLSFISPLSLNVATSNVSIDLTAYSTTAINNTTYLKLTGGTLTGALTVPNITLGGNSGKINVIDDYHYIEFSQATDTTTIQEYGTIKFNIGQTKTTKAYINSSGLTATAFSGDGANITNVPYASITGKPTYFAIDPAIYYTQTQTNTNISTAQTNNSNYSFNISNVLNINSSNYASNVSNILTTRDAINLTNSSNYASNISNILKTDISISSSNYANSIGNLVLNVLNTNIINSSNYASNVSNIIITNTNATYLKLAGGTMTGDLTGTTITAGKVNCSDATGVDVSTLGRNLNIVGTAAVMRIWRNNTAGNPSIDFMSGPTTSAASYVWFWDMYIATAIEANYFAIRDRKTGGGSPIRLLIDTNGNIGIGTITPSSKLHIEHSSTSTLPSNSGIYVYNPTNVANNSSMICARIGGNLANKALYSLDVNGQYGWCMYINGNDTTNRTLRFNASWDALGTDILTMKYDGNVGIGITNPFATLTLGTPIIAAGISNPSFVIARNNGSGNRSYKMAIDDSFNLAIGDFGNALTGNTWLSTQLTMSYFNGNVGIGISNQSQKLYVNGTSYLNGASTVNGSLAVNGDLTVQDGSSIRFGNGGSDGRIYRAGGNVFIEADDYIFLRSTFGGFNGYFNQGSLTIPAAINTDGTLYAASTATIGGLLRHRQSFNYGETLTYTVGYNGGNQSGWFWTTNGFWDGFATTSYLTVAVYCPGLSVWFGRAYLGAGGGFYRIDPDYINPTGSALNALQVVDYWGPNGANSLRIITTNGGYGGSMIIKISG